MSRSVEAADKHVGARIRFRRMLLGMSQTELGQIAGITFQQIQKYEKGTNRVSASRLVQFGQALQVPVSFFFEGADHVKRADASIADAFFGTRDGVNLAKAFMAIPNRDKRRKIVELVEAIAS